MYNIFILSNFLENRKLEMGFWKVIGGACAGIAVVVALPVAGPVGAITAVGAAVAAGIGAVAGGVAEHFDDSEEQAREDGYREGRKDAKTECSVQIENIKNKLEKTFNRFKESADYYRVIIAMEAVAVSCANCDGEIADVEKEQIEMFISGVSRSALPSAVKERIQDIYDNPPTIREAFKLAKESNMGMSIFDDIINLVVHADGIVHKNEEVFMQAWNSLKAA